MNTPSKEDWDNLFGPMFEDYFEKKSSDTTINFAAQLTHNQEDSPSTSLIIVDTHEAPPIVITSDEQNFPISLQESNEFNQEDSADFDGNTQFVPCDSLNQELKKALYGLKQAPRAWYDKLSSFLIEHGFTKDFSKRFANLMKNNLEMSMMGELKFFLGLQVHQSPHGIFISQSQYTIELLKKHGLDERVSMSTPMATPTDQTTYRRGKLVSWSLKKQDCTAMSTAEAEYVSLSACCVQVIWMRTQLLDYGYKYNRIPMYCDSKSAIAIHAIWKMSSLKAKQPKKPPPKKTRNVGKSKRTQLTTSSSTESPPSDNKDLPSTKLSPRSYHGALKDDPNMSKEQRETRGVFKNLGRALQNFARILKKGCR
ncbi:retrovirus-related pol polyprotein from transposon TNT 1-94 [Tanacetum coccineum]